MRCFRFALVLFGAVVVAVAATVAAVPVPEKKNADPPPTIEGTWHFTKMEMPAGLNAPPEEMMQRMRMKIEKDKQTVTGAADEPIVSKLAVDYAKSPITFDFTPMTGPGQGKTIRGICRREGDTLTICLTEHDNSPRPTEFKAGTGILLLTLKLAK